MFRILLHHPLLCQSNKSKDHRLLEYYKHVFYRCIQHKDLEDNKQRLENIIKDAFGITPGIYEGDIFLACVLRSTKDGYDAFRTLLLGMLNREETSNKKARVLEIIDSNFKEPFHSFLLSHVESSTWYCIYDCFWSHDWGEGLRHPIIEIRQLIKDNIDQIDYKEKRMLRGYLEGMFDPFYTESYEQIEYNKCYLKKSYYKPKK
ncbi:MAG: hypothetical protein FK730_08100 [Asgard group archaeon]|nr:hypothetical protein [Asgard group archaeon]